MNPKLAILYQFLQSIYCLPVKRRGKPYHYNWPSLLLFFMVMFLKGIHSFKAMASYARQHSAWFGWQSPPSRQTLARRFAALPAVIYRLMPLVAQAAAKEQPSIFSFRWVFIDKSVFRAKGGLWHRKQRLLGLVPHSSIDMDASWAKSAYHGCGSPPGRFGYGLHLLCNSVRFPLCCSVTTGAQKDTTQVVPLLVHFADIVGIVVADAGYVALRLLKQLLHCWQVLLLLPKAFTGRSLTDFQLEYNGLVQTPQAHWLYQQRKPSIEPLFALIKELFHLSGENQLPYQGLRKVKPYLMMTACTVQLMMYYNQRHRVEMATTQLFLTDFK